MATAWFVLIVLMLIVYVVLDGFDFGAGILHLLVARTDDERRTVLRAIGPLWDGNEVWLIAAGGVSVFAFPRAYAAGFSGFYLALIFALWLLVARALSIEFRSKEAHPLWRQAWDAGFFASSTAMAIILGAALGNLVRGVPLDASGYFAGPLFTDWRPGPDPGVLDWYTVTVGLFALVVLAEHGALYLVWKTAGDVARRSRDVARRVRPLVAGLAVVVTMMTLEVQPLIRANLARRPALWPLALLIVGGFGVSTVAERRGRELAAFVAFGAFIAGLLGITAATVYPDILISTHAAAYSLTVHNAAAPASTLRIGFVWWSVAIALAVGYFVHLFRSFAGKVAPGGGEHGY
jgi:cytochrome bd ubiquinol oxidase subunit II